MMDPAGHPDSRNLVESILRHIPGFRGYLEKEYRRDSDALTRTRMADELQATKELLDQYQRQLVDSAQLDPLPACERLRTRIDTLQSRIRGAMRGYSGFFDYVQIDTEVLDEVYQLDLALATDTARLRQEAAELAQAGSAGATPAGTGVADLLQRVQQLHARFDRRAEILAGIDPKQP